MCINMLTNIVCNFCDNLFFFNSLQICSVTQVKCILKYSRLIFSLQDYLAHIIDTADLPIKPEQVCALFGNIEDIYEFNR